MYVSLAGGWVCDFGSCTLLLGLGGCLIVVFCSWVGAVGTDKATFTVSGIAGVCGRCFFTAGCLKSFVSSTTIDSTSSRD